MASKKQKTAAADYADDAEVEAAIKGISDVDGARLGKVASFRARGLAGLGLGVSADDLLQDAVARTLGGDRRWRKGVTIVKHLIETMRSTANHWREKHKGSELVPATSEDGRGQLDGVRLDSPTPDGERLASAKEQLAALATAFDTDVEVGLALEGLAEGKTGPDIQADLNINETEYETIMTRLRRGLDRKQGWRL